MNLDEALKAISIPVGYTSLIAAMLGGDKKSISLDDQKPLKSLQDAQKQLAAVEAEQAECQSDAAYWGYMGQISYWRAIVNIFTAAEMVGADKLPDVPPPDVMGCVVMDACDRVEYYGKEILRLAEEE